MSIIEKYTDPTQPSSFSGLATFAKNKSAELKKTVKEIEKLKAYTLHKPSKKKFARRKVIVPFVNHQWAGDLVDVQKLARLNKETKYILLMIDAFSKKLYFAFLKDKTAQSTLNGIKRIIRVSHVTPKYIQTDKGKEFENSVVQSFLKQKGVKWFHTYTKIKASIVERVIRTIMSKLSSIEDRIEEYDSKFSLNFPELRDPPEIDVTELTEAVKGIKKGSHDLNEPSLQFIKRVPILLPYLTLIFTAFFKSFDIPNCLKTAKITPLYKHKGKKMPRRHIVRFRPYHWWQKFLKKFFTTGCSR